MYALLTFEWMHVHLHSYIHPHMQYTITGTSPPWKTQYVFSLLPLCLGRGHSSSAGLV